MTVKPFAYNKNNAASVRRGGPVFPSDATAFAGSQKPR
jgi:hypothetical protein